MNLSVIDAVNDPGTPGKTGDDRFGFDAAAGTAWVLDGATDVTDLRPFPQAESGAAWMAEALSARLMQGPDAGETPEAYFARVLADVRIRAEAESRIPLDTMPGEALPISSGIWMHLHGNRATFAYMGDCLAIVRNEGVVYVVGAEDKVDDETDAARSVLAMTPDERLGWLRQSRRLSNDIGSCFGLGPAGAANLQVERVLLQPGDEVCLMSDGLFRLVSPYETCSPEELMQALEAQGLPGLVRTLRRFENAPGNDIPRIKLRDDASAVYLKIEA